MTQPHIDIDMFDVNDVYCSSSGEEWQVGIDHNNNKKWINFRYYILDPSPHSLEILHIVSLNVKSKRK